MSALLNGRGLLLFSEVFLAWQVASYLFEAKLKPAAHDIGPQAGGSRDSVTGWWIRVALEAVAFGCLTCAAAEGSGRFLLSLFVAAMCLALPALRRYAVPRKFLAELELGANIFLSLGTIWWIGRHGLASAWTFQMEPARLAAYCLVAGLLVFLGEGGSLVVVGMLARGGTLTPSGESAEVSGETDTKELKHGQIIGKIERFTLALLIANGQFQSMAFFFAAKGLIRSKELEKRAWADYLLLGSLTSFLTALVAGLLMSQALQWK